MSETRTLPPEADIYVTRATEKRIRTEDCPDCMKRTRMLEILTPLHGWYSTCLLCGREWADGEWLPLNFERGARMKNIESAKKRWRLM